MGQWQEDGRDKERGEEGFEMFLLQRHFSLLFGQGARVHNADCSRRALAEPSLSAGPLEQRDGLWLSSVSHRTKGALTRSFGPDTAILMAPGKDYRFTENLKMILLVPREHLGQRNTKIQHY